MTFGKLRAMHKNQRGFTLIELVIAVAIISLIIGGTTLTLQQVINGNTRSSSHMTTIRQVQNAGYWVSQDAQMAQIINTDDDPGTPELELVTLTWTEFGVDGDEHQVIYTLVDNKLKREHYTNLNLDATTVVAEFIDPDPTMTRCVFPSGGTFSLPDSGDAVTITDAVGGDSGTITVTAGSITATPTGNATVAGGTVPVAIDSTSGAVAWTTSAATDTVVVAATAPGTLGSWTSTTGTATAAITTDIDGDATLSDGRTLVLTVTATITGQQPASETRTYEIIPRPGT